ncbi:MAG: hypothetical protein J2P25_00240 [Nocardiopsaceae bacterium]|nr:hypothetical protein [Nocardiopsaceae bacterium]
MQSRLYSPGYASPARWILFEPSVRKAFSAIGKDVVPDVISVLAQASGGAARDMVVAAHPHVTSGHLDSLVRAHILLDSPPPDPAEASSFTVSFHQANVDYPFFDYGSPEVAENESKLLDRYASLWPPPPAVLERKGPRYALPACDADLGLIPEADDGLTLGVLAWILKLVLAPIDEIKTRHVTCVRRTTPSGGARHPTELSVVMHAPLAEVPAGTYTYDISSHSLVAEPFPVHESYAARLGQRDIGFVIRSRVDRAMWRYRDLRALRPLLIDSGHVTELVAYLLGRLAMHAEVISAPAAPGRPSWLHEPEVVMVRASRLPTSHDQPTSLFHPPSQAHSRGESGAFLTNPAMVLRFTPALSAGVVWPVSARVALSLDDFLILNYCLPSTRGDRDQTMPGIVKAVPGADRSTIERLAACGALLPVAEAAPLYDDLRLWVRHEWYLAFLTYAEALERGAASPVVSRVPGATGYLTDVAALFRRHTSRVFAPEPVSLTSVEILLGRVVPGDWWPGLEISIAAWNVEGLAPGLYRWRDGHLTQCGEIPPRELVAAHCAGQTATSSGALTIWLSALSDPGHPGQYLMDLVDLGRLGQRICMAATELGVATFLSPAVYDRPACSMLSIGQAERRITYVFGLGSPASSQSASIKSVVTE